MNDQPDFQAFSEKLLDERNLNWVEPIKELMHEKVVFIAVGAGHLPGELGMINLLRQEGYTVKPILPQAN